MLSVLQAVQLLRRKQKLRAPLRKLLAIAYVGKKVVLAVLYYLVLLSELNLLIGRHSAVQLRPPPYIGLLGAFNFT